MNCAYSLSGSSSSSNQNRFVRDPFLTSISPTWKNKLKAVEVFPVNFSS